MFVTADRRPVLRLHLEENGKTRTETTRKLILANGVDGNGKPFVPPVLRPAVTAGLAAHTADAIDFAALRGKTVAVLGAAASAFDAAAAVLESGAEAVHLFARRDRLAAIPVIRARLYPGYYDNFHALPDATRWHHAARYRRLGSTPPADSIARVLKFANFHLHLSSPWTSADIESGNIHVFNPAGFASAGVPLGDVLSMRRDIPAVVARVSRDLFFADIDQHEKRTRADVPADFGPELYGRALWTATQPVAVAT